MSKNRKIKINQNHSVFMKLEDFVAVSGLPGLYKMAANRSNGLIIEDLDTGKKRFASVRKHQFTPLESIVIFTEDEDDSAELKKVFTNMLKQLADNPIPPNNAKPDELRTYFTKVLPDHDKDQVHPSDIKKIIKWFQFLNDRSLLSLETDSSEEE